MAKRTSLIETIVWIVYEWVMAPLDHTKRETFFGAFECQSSSEMHFVIEGKLVAVIDARKRKLFRWCLDIQDVICTLSPKGGIVLKLIRVVTLVILRLTIRFLILNFQIHFLECFESQYLNDLISLKSPNEKVDVVNLFLLRAVLNSFLMI